MGARPTAAIVGAALSDVGRVDHASVFALHHQAASRALAHAGLDPQDIDGFASAGTGVLAPIEVAEYLGLRPTWVDSTTIGGSTWLVMLEHAVAAIVAGHATTVLIVYGSTARADLKRRITKGEVHVAQVVLSPPREAETATLLEMLRSVPRVGTTKVRTVCFKAHVDLALRTGWSM